VRPANPRTRAFLSRFHPAASQVRTCLSREFAFLGREAGTSSFPSRVSCTLGPVCGCRQTPEVGDRVPELGSLGSVRGRPAMSVPTANNTGRGADVSTK
jgi:hypothetical protein